MTPETEILQELVEAVNRPDWWSVIATIIAAIVAAVITYVLGRRQNRLQEQQLKLQEQQNGLQEQQLKIQEHQNELQEQQIRQQEYELYRRMYSQVFELDFFNKTMLQRIVAILVSNEDKNLRLKLIDDIWKEYEKRSEDFGECTLDMDLKQCGEGIDAKYYFDALQASRNVILIFKYFIEDELLVFNPSLANNPQIEERTISPEKMIDIILQLFKGRNRQFLRDQLRAYADIVERTNQAQILKIVKERITPNDKAKLNK